MDFYQLNYLFFCDRNIEKTTALEDAALIEFAAILQNGR